MCSQTRCQLGSELALLTTILAILLLCLIDAWRVSHSPARCAARDQKAYRQPSQHLISYAGENSVLHYL